MFWYNYKQSGDMDYLFLHAACPVLMGEKWGRSLYVTTDEQDVSEREASLTLYMAPTI